MDETVRNRQGVEYFFNYIKDLKTDADERLANSRSVKEAQAKSALLSAKCGLGCLEELIKILDGLPEGQREWAIECLWHGMQAIFMIGAYANKMPGGGIAAREQREQAAGARWHWVNLPENRKRGELIEAAIIAVPLKGGRHQINKIIDLAIEWAEQAGLPKASRQAWRSAIKRCLSTGKLGKRGPLLKSGPIGTVAHMAGLNYFGRVVSNLE
jgi:hypothetical protein